jgi:hypothetical protein
MIVVSNCCVLTIVSQLDKAANICVAFAESTTIGSLSNSAFVSGMAAELGGGLVLNSSVIGSLLYDTFLVGVARCIC